MVELRRAQYQKILSDLRKKMVLLFGPRQVGKTHIAKQIGEAFQHCIYLNYDNLKDRQLMLDEAWLPSTDILVLDELHKMPNWKNYLKGIYDTKPAGMCVLVTGSARLSVYQQMGDSLAGRYYGHHMLPITLSELKTLGYLHDDSSLDALMLSGGYPEPFLVNDEVEVSRWRTHYVQSMLASDVQELTTVDSMGRLKLVFELLRQRVGSPLSFRSIAEDVGVSQPTVRRYVEILEALYVVFRVTPFSRNIARSILKEPKVYFFDTGLVKGDDGIKFENWCAMSLLRQCYSQRDIFGKPMALHYLRTKDKQEVDFALVEDEKISQLIEVKWREASISPSLRLFARRYNLPAVQLVRYLRQPYQKDGVCVLDAMKYLAEINEGNNES